MSKRFLLRTANVLAIIFLCLGFSINTSAQQGSTGTITGQVSDSNGAAVPNATVKIKNDSTGAEQTGTANGEGLYNFVLLQPGTYTVTASAQGFAETKIEKVVVNVGRATDVNITMGASGVQETVEVTADAIQTTQNNSDAVLNETAINNLPILGRRFQDFVTLTPTAQVDPQRGQISLSGQRGINANINVDGVDYNQPFFGGIRGGERSNQAFTIPQESIKEFQVVAAGYSAEFGRSSGGIVNAVTKSGGNDIRGSLFYLLRHKELSRKSGFLKALEEDRRVPVIPAPTLQQFGGSIGGPIKKDKLFYFFAYEQQKFKQARNALFGGLNSITRSALNQEAFDFYRSQETPFTQTNDALAGLVRLDWQINDNNRFNIRYSYSQNKALNGNSTGEDNLDPTINRALSNNGTERNRNNGIVAQMVSNFGTNFVNEFRFQFAREDRPRFANSFTPQVASGLGTYGTRNFLPTTQFDERLQFADNFTVVTGNHSFKFGGEFSDIFVNQLFGFNQTGAYSPGGGSNDTQLQVMALNATPGTFGRRFDVTGASFLRQVGNLTAEFTVRELAFFAQDAWRIRPNFTLNYGIRFEEQFNPDPELGNTALISAVQGGSYPILGGKNFSPTSIPDSGWQVGPRLGFAWDPTKDGKTVVRGFAGLYYARTPLLVLAAPFNNFRSPAGDLSVRLPFTLSTITDLTSLNTFLTANPQYVAIMNATSATANVCTVGTATLANCSPNTIFRQFATLGINLNNFTLGNLPNLSVAQIQQISQRLNPTFDPLVAGVQPIGIETDFKNPRSFQYGFAVEREMGRGFVVGVDYSSVNTTRLQRNRDINLPAPILRDTTTDPAQRPFIGVTAGRARPVAVLGSVQLRESSARSFYQSLTFRSRVTRKWGQLNAYFTLSRSKSDDDNERDAGGAGYDNSFDLRSEYNYSRLDRRFQFVANPVFFLPYGFEVSSAIRLRSGLPVDAVANSDLNADGVFNDRPFLVPGVPLKRNSFRNRAIYEADLRVQKGFSFKDRQRLILSMEIFNVLGRENMQLAGTAVTAFCNPTGVRCGLDGITNVNFLQVFDQNPSSTRFGKYLLNNNLGTRPFQIQLGARFQF